MGSGTQHLSPTLVADGWPQGGSLMTGKRPSCTLHGGNIIPALSPRLLPVCMLLWLCPWEPRGPLGGGGVGFVFWSTGSRGGFWAPNTRKSKRALGASGLGLSPGPGTSKLSDLCEPPSLCEGHSGIWHPFLEQRLGAGHAGHRGHQENPVVHCSSLVFLSLYVLVSHGCSSKSPSNLLT